MALKCQKVVVEQPRTVPAPLLVNKPVPEWQGGSLRDAVVYGARSNAAARKCEADRTVIRTTQEEPVQ